MNSIPLPTPKSKPRKPQSESKLRKPQSESKVPKWKHIGERFQQIQNEAARKKAAEEEKKKHENPCNKYWVKKARHAPFWTPPKSETEAADNYCKTVSKDYKCLPTMNYPDGNMGVEYPLGVCQIPPPPPPPPVFEEPNVSSVNYRGGGVKKSKKRRKSRKTKKKKHRRRTRRRRTRRRRTRRRKRR
tara:strand:+ start:33 stop:593 length:561 start_codon:yes stop_codon:yes gene_type:complete